MNKINESHGGYLDHLSSLLDLRSYFYKVCCGDKVVAMVASRYPQVTDDLREYVDHNYKQYQTNSEPLTIVPNYQMSQELDYLENGGENET